MVEELNQVPNLNDGYNSVFIYDDISGEIFNAIHSVANITDFIVKCYGVDKMKKRYLVEMTLFVYADNDKEAVDKAKKLGSLIDNCGDLCSTDLDANDLLREQNDNKCGVVSIHERPFGNIEMRKVEL